jgi:Protein of unknown function (DUF2917)
MRGLRAESAMEQPNQSSQIGLKLQQGQVVSSRTIGGFALECTHGSIWITFENDRWDHVLVPGERLQLGARGHAVIEALEPSELAVYFPAATRVGSGKRPAGERSGRVRAWIAALTSHRLNMEFLL